MFQDDLLLPECLARTHAVAEDTEIPIISCARDFIFEDAASEELRAEYLNHKARIQATFAGSAQWSAREFCEAVLQSVVVRKHPWRADGGIASPRRLPEVWMVQSTTADAVRPRILGARGVKYRYCSHPGDSRHIPSTRGVDIRSLQGARSPSVSVRYGRPTTRYPRLRIHPLFATLRATAANRRPRVDLVNEFWKRALLVHWLAKHAATDRVARDASLLDEWRIAVQACPRLASIPFKARLLSKLSAFEKTVTSRAEGRRGQIRKNSREDREGEISEGESSGACSEKRNTLGAAERRIQGYVIKSLDRRLGLLRLASRRGD